MVGGAAGMRFRGAWFAAAVLIGCSGRGIPELAGDLGGSLLPAAVPRPSFGLTTVAGEPYEFRARTAGRLTLLFFGYTHCPDVCPATMANLGAVLRGLSSSERALIDAIFVTTDPERDSSAVLGPWLANFEPHLIGLVGSTEALRAAQIAAGIGVAVREDTPSGGYAVSHAAQVLVYSPDDSGHLSYPFGTRQAQWAVDLPKLLERWKGPAR